MRTADLERLAQVAAGFPGMTHGTGAVPQAFERCCPTNRVAPIVGNGSCLFVRASGFGVIALKQRDPPQAGERFWKASVDFKIQLNGIGGLKMPFGVCRATEYERDCRQFGENTRPLIEI